MLQQQNAGRSDEESQPLLDRARERYEDRARREARRRGERARMAVGRRAFDALESYFPEEARSRRRRVGATTFVVGVAVGVLLRHLAGR